MTVSLPAGTGRPDWCGGTKLVGHNVNLRFLLAEAGQHQMIPEYVMPGARARTYRRRGFDLVLYEARDRSNSCLVWAGPHNEATTWLSGPALRPGVLNRISSMVDFRDTRSGAVVGARKGVDLQQLNTRVSGWSDDLVLFARSAATARDQMPTWKGAARGDEEVWKQRLDLDPEERAELAGTPHEWRYIFANETTLYEVIFPSEAGRTRALHGARGERAVRHPGLVEMSLDLVVAMGRGDALARFLMPGGEQRAPRRRLPGRPVGRPADCVIKEFLSGGVSWG